MNEHRRKYIDLQTAERDRLIDSIRDAIAKLRPMGVASEISMAMGTRPSRGQLIGTPVGTFVFAKSRTPTEEQIDEWHETYRRAEDYGRNAAIAGSFGVVDPGCTIGNAEFMLNGCLLRDFNCTSWFGEPNLSLLDDDELEFLTKLIVFWNENPDSQCGVVNDDGTITEFVFGAAIPAAS